MNPVLKSDRTMRRIYALISALMLAYAVVWMLTPEWRTPEVKARAAERAHLDFEARYLR